MQEKSTRQICRISTLFAEDSLVKVFQSQESGAGLPTQEELCSLKSLGLPQLKDLNIFCLRTYPGCYRMTEAGRLQQSSARFQSWGTTSRGRCLMSQTMPSPIKPSPNLFRAIRRTLPRCITIQLRAYSTNFIEKSFGEGARSFKRKKNRFRRGRRAR